MISLKLRIIFYTSIPLFVAHGMEEYINHLYNVHSSFKWLFSYFDSMAIPQATFLLFQIAFWLLLIISAVLLSGEKWRLYMMILPGLIFIFELHHFWKAYASWNYYPGVITAIGFPILGFFYWKELIRLFGAKK
ncbi:HXXEE domain-containing protein [Candidatus Kaiserbacteria bacterium]|nr:HXXEE domain-containing protein [Candidatus Kaiserbacteria bacterium]